MDERLPSHMLVGSLLRRVQSAGGFATVLHKGDPTGGVILVECLEQGRHIGLFERIADLSGTYRLVACGPISSGDSSVDAHHVVAYAERRRRSDPDLWLIELDVAQAERFAAETIC